MIDFQKVFFFAMSHKFSARLDKLCCVCAVCRNVLSSQEVVDFVSERIKPDESGNVRPLSSIVEEVRATEHCTH